MNANLIILSCGLGIALASTVRAQSIFEFKNFNQSYGVNAPVSDAGGVRLAGPNYAAELWGGQTVNSLTPAMHVSTSERIIIPFATGTAAGYFQSSASMAVQADIGEWAWLQVRAWDTRFGSSYEQVAALGIGGYGESPEFYAQGTDIGDQFPVPAPLVGLQSFSLRPVIPEPSTWALFALGGVAVAWAARQQRQRRS